MRNSLFAASQDCVKIIDLDGNVTAMNPSGLDLMEIDDFCHVQGRHWPELWPEDHKPTVAQAIDTAKTGQVVRFTATCPTFKGKERIWEVTVSPVFEGIDGQEAPSSLLTISRDITDYSHIKEQNEVLALELTHRIKNIFAVVDGVIAMQERSVGHPPLRDLRERIRGIGRAIDFISPEHDHTVNTLHGLLNTLLEPYGLNNTIFLYGIDLPIKAAATTAVALFTNELATNALKYGALSRPGGNIKLTISTKDDCVLIHWVERGGPLLTIESMVTGFGTKLLDMTVRRHMHGKLTRNWNPAGLEVCMEIPAMEFSESP